MKNLVNINTNQPLTMSSREIAELLNKQHPHIKISAERLSSKGVIALRETQYRDPQNKQIYTEYLLTKRDCLILVAQNCPEFTADIVDRWQELEQKQAQLMLIESLPSMSLAIKKEQELLEHEEKSIIARKDRIFKMERMEELRDEYTLISEQIGAKELIEESNPQYGREAEDLAVLEYMNNANEDSVNFNNLCKSVIRKKDSPFKIYTRRGEAREQVRNTVARLDEIINRRIH